MLSTGITQALEVAGNFSAPVMLVFVGWACWKSARWIAPRGDSVVTGHLDFLRTTKDLLSRQATEQRSQGDTLRQMATDMRETRDDMREAREEGQRLAERIVELFGAAVERKNT